MHQDDKFYTFLLSHFIQFKKIIGRQEVSKRICHTSIAILFLLLITFTIGFVRALPNNVLADSEAFLRSNPAVANQQLARQNNQPQTTAEYKSFNYDRPATNGDDFAFDSGGPIDLTENESEAEETAMEGKIRLIEATGNPAFLPTMWAHLGKINNEFGYRRNPFGGRGYEFHTGLDIDGERGDSVAAPANGVVTKAGWEGGYGNMIEIDHGNGLMTRYGHLSKIGVSVGDTILRGQLIGLIGSTGRSTGPHLHYELRLNDKAINPRRLLPPEPAEIKALNNAQ